MTDVVVHFLVFAVVSVAALLAPLLLGYLVRPKLPTPEKDTAYECGMVPQGGTQPRFSVKFYLVAMLFIIFDIETVFMIPWAVAFRQLSEIGGLLIIEMFVFILVLGVGYVYIWKRGALEWD